MIRCVSETLDCGREVVILIRAISLEERLRWRRRVLRRSGNRQRFAWARSGGRRSCHPPDRLNSRHIQSDPPQPQQSSRPDDIASYSPLIGLSDDAAHLNWGGSRSESRDNLKLASMNIASKLILASGSPRRRELLTRAHIDFEVVQSGLDEIRASTTKRARDYALRMARDKALAVSAATSTALGACRRHGG